MCSIIYDFLATWYNSKYENNCKTGRNAFTLSLYEPIGSRASKPKEESIF
jgi:hypothetical protein